jgi:RNA-directed DNA polymerase
VPDFPKTVPELANNLDVLAQELSFLAGSVEHAIKLKKLPKPNGEERTITVPSQRLKAFLSRLDSAVLRQVPLHPLLYHRPGSSYIEMIRQHRRSRCLITADIDDFYPSVTRSKVFRALLSQGFEQSVAKIITRLTTVFHSLPQGFPTSPTIAGIVLRPVAIRLEGLVGACRLRIGIYADNLAISANYDATKFETLIKRIFLQSGYKLDKWRVMMPSQRQEIMNIVVSNGMSVKAEYRNEVRRDILILSKLKESQPSGEFSSKLASLRGKLNHIYNINPSQFNSLGKYARRLGVDVWRDDS